MLWLHPALQLACLALATWVLFMGLNRFRFQHLGVKCQFAWKRHVFWGKVVNFVWLLGWAFGLVMAKIYWGSINLTEDHFLVGTLMVPLILISLVTGFMLQTPKGKRPRLALTHGITNMVLYLMALFQLYSAVEVVNLFLL